jgi:hypothetical protein
VDRALSSQSKVQAQTIATFWPAVTHSWMRIGLNRSTGLTVAPRRMTQNTYVEICTSNGFLGGNRGNWPDGQINFQIQIQKIVRFSRDETPASSESWCRSSALSVEKTGPAPPLLHTTDKTTAHDQSTSSYWLRDLIGLKAAQNLDTV